ncbi:hypothetical protein MRB53_030717 [Persea americana]|uniref:Uncharacterized protein n=1 Tax=Persea americana TaxID=3435 RepID=A0ACC2KMD5_PERAE|nr:hypothetical protein MRB53_030717 [Persea americana]
MDPEAARNALEYLELAFQMSNILVTGLDRHTLSILIALFDRGLNPEALVALVRELRNEPHLREVPADTYDRATSILVHLNDLEQMIQQIIDMGGGSWDLETVVRALRAAYNNPERAVEYLYSGIPEETEVAIPVSRLPSNQASRQRTNTITETNPAGAAPLSGLPNSSP